MRSLALVGVLGVLPAAALADPQAMQTRYSCERGVVIEAAYITADQVSYAVIQAEGRLVILKQAVSGSAVRYTSPAGQSGYTWWTKGDTAMLSWFDADLTEEVFLLHDCRIED